MATTFFTDKDIRQIERNGIKQEEVIFQLETFNKGIVPIKLKRQCTIGDGVEKIPDSKKDPLIKAYDAAAKRDKMIKFVPASGAASRMFREWFHYYETKVFESREEEKIFIRNLHKFAFYEDLKEIISRKGKDINDLISDGNFVTILEYILTPEGLNYGNLPKALLKFHAYSDHNRTPIDEHIVEAALYAKDIDSISRIHFTVSGEYKKEVERYIPHIKEFYEQKYNLRFEISLSIQLPSTNTIAVTMDNKPFRDRNGNLIFRPGGHGALLKNLNGIDANIIFIKNIDNVVSDKLKGEIVFYKKLLGGYLVQLQEEVFHHLRYLESQDIDEKAFLTIVLFCKERLCLTLPSYFNELSYERKRQFIFDKLNRPIRICGMVKNEGEPGGGPFWVEEKDGTLSLQIVEEAQINICDKEQKSIWESSTHFNPVDLVCGVKDFQGNKFDLEDFVNQDTCLITKKSHTGKGLKALELPGLWNGSMAFWNTVFVEVPVTTFNPVKTVNDLLRKQHANI